MSGQNNRALFYGVDYTCYVEGGANDNDERSIDALFWEQILTHFRPDITVIFLPRGGKPVLEALAREIVDKSIDKTFVAMDSDYDHLIGDAIADHRILYTYGYSWENDVLDVEFIPEIIRIITHKVAISEAVRENIIFAVEGFASQIRRGVQADLAALVAGSSVLPRDAPGRVIKTGPEGNSILVERKELVKLTRAANAKTQARDLPALPEIPSGVRFLVGHCAMHATAIIIRAALRQIGIRKSITSDHLKDVAVLALRKQFRMHSNHAITKHHAGQCAALK